MEHPTIHFPFEKMSESTSQWNTNSNASKSFKNNGSRSANKKNNSNSWVVMEKVLKVKNYHQYLIQLG